MGGYLNRFKRFITRADKRKRTKEFLANYYKDLEEKEAAAAAVAAAEEKKKAAEEKKKAAEEKKKAAAAAAEKKMKAAAAAVAAAEEKKKAAEKKKKESFEVFCLNQNVPEELINLSDPLVTEIDDIGYVNGKEWITIDPMIPIIRSILLSKNSENKLSIEDGDFLVKHIDQVQLLEQIGNGEMTMKEAMRILQSEFKGSPEAVNLMLDGMSEEVVRKLKEMPLKSNSDFNKGG